MRAQRKRDSRTSGGSQAETVKPNGATVNPGLETADPRPAVSHEDIASLAYGYWEARGGQDGSADEDWYRAEQELLSRLAVQAPERPRRKAAASATAG